MASIIVSIDVEDENVKDIKQQLQWLKEGQIPDGSGWFNPDGKIAIDNAMLEVDLYDGSFYVMDFVEVRDND